MEIQNYEQALQFIHGRTQFKKIPTLKRMRRLMQELGDPQKTLTMIHVTGTNGKGSTVAFLRSILMAAGNHVGTFTSPFITRFNERISLDNQPIDDQNLVTYTQRVKTVVDHLDQVLTGRRPN
jgi:dihydrofolate synthase/folylpolyglutamate synthase